MSTESTLDSWQPTFQRPKHIPSKWREEQNGQKHNVEPSTDDIKKIKSLLRKGVNDAELMHTFGLTVEIMSAIKKGNYTATDGIGYDNSDKILNKFKLLDRKIDYIHDALAHIIACMGFDEKETRAFNIMLGKRLPREDEDDEAI